MKISDNTHTYLEELLKTLFQKYLKFYLKGKVCKEGRFILFKQNNFHYTLTLKNEKKGLEKFEIPVPFNIEEWEAEDGVNPLVYFDYRLSTLAKNNNELLKILSRIPKEGNNKFYNSILEIEIIPD